jgi:predicted RecB family nuclease
MIPYWEQFASAIGARSAARAPQRLRRQSPANSYPDPCPKCGQCRWSDLCEAQRVTDDHLWQVAGISRLQMLRLADSGVTTMTALAAHPGPQAVPRMTSATFGTLHTQSRLHVLGKTAGAPRHELRTAEPGRGFHRLPPPSQGDLYFDMEGDPLHEDGLEYLFGVTWREGGALRFRAFRWHTRRCGIAGCRSVQRVTNCIGVKRACGVQRASCTFVT